MSFLVAIEQPKPKAIFPRDSIRSTAEPESVQVAEFAASEQFVKLISKSKDIYSIIEGSAAALPAVLLSIQLQWRLIDQPNSPEET